MTDKISKKPIPFIAVLLILITVAAYENVRNHEFINFDDDIYVTDNQIVKEGLTLKGISWALGFNKSGYWQPLTWLSHMLDCELYGLNPGRHHLTNLMIHLANTLLLFWTLYRMTGRVYRSALVAVFFAVHPLNVDSVAWVAERKNLLSTFFWMLSLLSYNRYAENPKPDRYMLTLILFVLGLMVKPMLVTLPFVLLLLDFWPLKRLKFGQRQEFGLEEPQVRATEKQHTVVSKLFIEKIPFFALSLGSVWLSISSTQHINNMIAADTVPMTLRISNALVSYVSYMGKMIWPLELAIYYPYPESIPLWQAAGAGVLLTAATVLFVFLINRKSYLAVGWLWYLGTLVPVIGIVQGGLWPEMADRWAYVPLIGLFVMIAWGVPDALQKWQFAKPVMTVMAIGIIGSLLIITQTQLQHWKNSKTLFEQTLKVTSDNTVAHNNLGNALLEEGKTEEALDHFMAALRIEPRHAGAQNNMGNVLMKLGRVDEATDHYLESIKIDPLKAKTHNNLAIALNEQKRIEESILHLREALQLKPNYADAYNNLGAVYRKKGKIQNAAKCYLEAIRLKPDFAEAYNNLGLLLCHEGKLKDAIYYFRKAISKNPDFKAARDNLKRAWTDRDIFNEAVAQIQAQLNRNPEDVELYLKLGDLHKEHGELNDALKQYQNALLIRPNFLAALNNVAIVHAMKGEYNKAIDLLKQLIKSQPDNPENYYYLAGIYSRKNKVGDSIDWLKKAIAKGYNSWDRLVNDSNFDSIKETSFFKALVNEKSI
jgi:tetratricopeptide (TPR) repeat protein